jgi:hypothetical protein
MPSPGPLFVSPRAPSRPPFDPAALALAFSVAATAWLRQVVAAQDAAARRDALVHADRAVFLFVLAFALLVACAALVARLRRDTPPPLSTASPAPLSRGRALAGAALLAAVVAALTLTHLDDRSPHLYLTTPPFPNGPGSGADGYAFWLEGHPTFMESWQFTVQAALYAGASEDRTTGLADARAGYAYLLALLALPLGYFWGAVLLNAVFWLAAALATWDVARRLLPAEPIAFGAALLVAGGQGFVALAGTPMSYVAGYAWLPILLALALRWNLPMGPSRLQHWALWGWVCGVAGLFYFTHLVALAVLWLTGLRRAPLRGLLLASALALAVPLSWELYGRALAGLRFEAGTAADLSVNLAGLLQAARTAPLTLPAEAGRGTTRALLGGFPFPLLPLAALGAAAAPPSRRTWYLIVAVCGLAPVMLLHHIPATQRYGYLAYPAVALAAAEGLWWLALRHRSPSAGAAPAGRRARGSAGPLRLATAGALLLGAVALAQAVADLWGVHHFALAFGAP